MRFKVVYRMELEQEVEAASRREAVDAAAKNATAAFANGGCTMQLKEVIVRPAADQPAEVAASPPPPE